MVGEEQHQWTAAPDRADDRVLLVGKAFLAASAIGAARTANAWRPVSRTGATSALALPGGLTVSEMPLHSLAWQAVPTAGFVAAAARIGGRPAGTHQLHDDGAEGLGLSAVHVRVDGVSLPSRRPPRADTRSG